jgi:hypothetical protein
MPSKRWLQENFLKKELGIVALTLLSVVAASQACSPAKFAKISPSEGLTPPNDTSGDMTGGEIPPSEPDTAICDPFGASSTHASLAGITGSIYQGNENQKSSTEMISNGILRSRNLFMSNIFVPGHDFNSGFNLQNNTALKDTNGQILKTYFALNLNSQLRLASSDAVGEYEFAVLADDGATLSIADSPSAGVLIENDQKQGMKIACANRTVRFTSKSMLVPMNLTYFQGPGYKLGLVLLWRLRSALQSKNVGQSAECLVDANALKDDSYYFSNGVPTDKFNALLEAGWSILKPENFILPPEVVNNCT